MLTGVRTEFLGFQLSTEYDEWSKDEDEGV